MYILIGTYCECHTCMERIRTCIIHLHARSNRKRMFWYVTLRNGCSVIWRELFALGRVWNMFLILPARSSCVKPTADGVLLMMDPIFSTLSIFEALDIPSACSTSRAMKLSCVTSTGVLSLTIQPSLLSSISRPHVGSVSCNSTWGDNSHAHFTQLFCMS